MNPTIDYICCDNFNLKTVKAIVAEYGINPIIRSNCGNDSTEELVKPIEVDTPKTYDSVLIGPNPAKDKINFTE